MEEPDDKILNVEEEFHNISVTLQGYIKELHESQQNFLQNLTDIRQKTELVPSTLEIIKTDSLALSNAVRDTQQEISQLNEKFLREQKDLFQKFEIQESCIQEINNQYRDFQNRTEKFFMEFPGLQKPREDTIQELQKQVSQLNTDYNNDREKKNQLLLDVSTLSASQHKIVSSIQEIQHDLSENNGINNKMQDLLPLIRDINHHLNNVSSLIEKAELNFVSFEGKFKILNDQIAKIENSSATHFAEINSQVSNEFNQFLTAQENCLKNFQTAHEKIAGDILTNQERIEKLSHLYEDNITIFTKEIDTLSAKLENQNQAIQEIKSICLYEDSMTNLIKEIDTVSIKLENQDRAIQEINSIYQKNISRLDKVNSQVQRQNTILMILMVVFVVLSIIIAVAFK